MKRLLILALLAGCSGESDPAKDMGVAWSRTAAEYDALALQAYGEATRDLPGFVADTSFSALPWQIDAKDLPPAVILDVDETVTNHAQFQLEYERPFTDAKFIDWNREHEAVPLAGVADFVAAAEASGVTVFFVTNRPCAVVGDDPCPQKQVTIDDLAEAGIVADASRVMLAREQAHWLKEKESRRREIAEEYRVIMLFGDDLGDFILCARKTALAPCEQDASHESRRAAVFAHSQYLGNGWYVLPNPMYGSWTRFVDEVIVDD